MNIQRLTLLLITLVFLVFFIPKNISAHSGRTDSSGGHNCNVGACAGTYHYHNGGYTAPVYNPSTPTPTPAPKPTPSPSPTPTPEVKGKQTSSPTAQPTQSPISSDSSSGSAFNQFLGFMGWSGLALFSYLFYKNRKNKKLEKKGGEKE